MSRRVPPAASMARTAACEKRMRPDGERLGQLAAAEHLHQTPLRDQPALTQCLRRDLRVRVEPLERRQVHDVVLDAERVLESLRLGRPPVQWCLTPFEADGHGAARALTLGAAAGGLPALAADAATDASFGSTRTRARVSGRGPSLDLLYRDEMGHTRHHPADFGAVGQDVRASRCGGARARARCPGASASSRSSNGRV